MKKINLFLKATKSGFTLVELLVVIAIITLLGSTILLQVEKARAKARDAQREKDIKTLQDSLALYVINNKVFPIAGNMALTGADTVSQELVNKEALPKVPIDPLHTGNYQYIYNSSDGSTYTLTYYLETDSVLGKSLGIQTASP